MDKIKVAFVILHYMTYIDTIECVQSIRRNIDVKNYKIIIVDNYSVNESLEVLKNKFGDYSDIVIIENNQNLGFSKGLNKGILYARKEYDPDFIVTANNDVWLLCNCFFKIIKEKYMKYDFALAGPMILTGDGKFNVNPIINKIRDRREAERLIKKHKFMLILSKFHTLYIYTLCKKIKDILCKINKKNVEMSLSDQIDYKLHGAFWIFSRVYFNRFEGLDPATFLYGEESLLYLHIMKNGLHTLYTPEIVIYHKEDSATNSLNQMKNEKIKFVCQHSIECLEYYLDVYGKYEIRDKENSGEELWKVKKN